MRSASPQHLTHGRRVVWDTAGVLLNESPFGGGPLDFAAIFGNGRPVELEIGAGKGTFLRERAAARPELNFLGIEWAKAYAQYAADRVRRMNLPNVRMLGADAGPFIANRIATASVWRVHIYFPDPWPKPRHHRRRIIQLPFVDQLRRILKTGGQLLIVTDHKGYFEHIREVFLTAGRFGFTEIDFPIMADRDGEVVGTNFERKYIAQGRPFHKLARLRID